MEKTEIRTDTLLQSTYATRYGELFLYRKNTLPFFRSAVDTVADSLLEIDDAVAYMLYANGVCSADLGLFIRNGYTDLYDGMVNITSSTNTLTKDLKTLGAGNKLQFDINDYRHIKCCLKVLEDGKFLLDPVREYCRADCAVIESVEDAADSCKD
ncbi:hypothetical protein RUMCAL_00311 [Ruminococcus callidus ATCC 27760]|jgi:hypothetical protein|uniref:Uncharacterized protein n=1 Tax=Ruminococcus callidus ATCC 27760 TaxID=411473 RepID=U2M672_9FIRM|nr:hypothetical protein [Ruminococcus callidus]ERJ97239.1 hypothetical protein RUMCAL_00311 [Ruminococcus callidus ATCC 27760]